MHAIQELVNKIYPDLHKIHLDGKLLIHCKQFDAQGAHVPSDPKANPEVHLEQID